MDAGFFALLKSLLRDSYGRWVMDLVMTHLDAGLPAGSLEVPFNKPVITAALMLWLAEAHATLRLPNYREKVRVSQETLSPCVSR